MKMNDLRRFNSPCGKVSSVITQFIKYNMTLIAGIVYIIGKLMRSRYGVRLGNVYAFTIAAFICQFVSYGDISTVKVGGLSEITRAPSGEYYASFPKTIYFDVLNGSNETVRKGMLSWSTGADDPSITTFSRKHTIDKGGTYSTTVTSPNIDFGTALKRRNGEIIALDFKPNYSTYWHTARQVNVTRPDGTFTYHTSTDNGATWTTHTDGSLSWGSNVVVGMRFHADMLEDSDGNLYAGGYMKFELNSLENETDYSARIMKSTNGGKDWVFLSTALPGASEMTMARCKDGSWLLVGRTDTGLLQTRSTNNGVTWSSPVSLSTGFPSGLIVDPRLLLMPNGILVLSYGSMNATSGGGRDVRIAFSADGNGTTWTNHTSTFVGNAGVLGEESTGYTGVFPITSDSILQIGDTGTDWSYAAGWENASPNPFSIWQKRIGVGLARSGRLDLKTLYANSLISVTSDMTYSNGNHPEARVAAVFDGSTDYWSGAFRQASSGEVVIDLGRVYGISSIGVALQYGEEETASISFSQDGTNWGSPVKTYGNAVHHAIDYTDFTVPISARYVEIVVSSAQTLTSLGEIEIYTTIDSFESDPYLSIPAGYSSSGMTWVTESNPYNSSRALLINDGSTSALAKISKNKETTKSKMLSFYVEPISIAHAIMFDLIGKNNEVAYHLGIFPDGSVKAYNGSSWSVVGSATASTVAVGTGSYSKITVEAPTLNANALLYVNGAYKGTVAPLASGVTGLKGFVFSSGSTAGTGDVARFDDVEFTALNFSKDTFEGDTIGNPPSGYDAGSVLSTVTNSAAFVGAKALRIYDNSTTQLARISRTTADPAPYKVLDFAAKMSLTNGFGINIRGLVGGAATNIFVVKIYSDGAVKYYNGTSYQQLAPAGTISNWSSWHNIRIEANASGANVYIDGEWLGVVGAHFGTATVIDGFRITSSATASTGDDVLMDEVYFGP